MDEAAQTVAKRGLVPRKSRLEQILVYVYFYKMKFIHAVNKMSLIIFNVGSCLVQVFDALGISIVGIRWEQMSHPRNINDVVGNKPAISIVLMRLRNPL